LAPVLSLGLTTISAWPNSGASATTFTIGAGIGLIVVQWLSSALGGFITGRLRTKWTGVHTHEVFFRDTAHGFLSWALATIVGAALLAAATTSIVGGGVRAASTVAGGAAQAATVCTNGALAVLVEPKECNFSALLRGALYDTLFMISIHREFVRQWRQQRPRRTPQSSSKVL
jgi:hypothetical protein